MRDFKKKLVSLPQIRIIARELKRKKKRIVTTNGVFDILHLGHITYLEQARKRGDVLIVGVNSDRSVRAIKGPKRPVNNQISRASCLASLECVDYVVIFPQKKPLVFLSAIVPSIHVKGGDYKGKENAIIERKVVEKGGGKIVLNTFVKGCSTTNVIAKIVKAYA